MKISIIDCQMGNIGSVLNIIKHVGYEADIISTPEEVLSSDKLIFPGVGHWDNGVKSLDDSGIKNALITAVSEKKTPILGICLGMQLLFSSSEEGQGQGLGFIPGRVAKFDFDKVNKDTQRKRLRIPHMGWNAVEVLNRNDPTVKNIEDDLSFYFVHSYHLVDVPSKYQLMSCKYGYEFICGVNRDNIWGVQFHPEKSHKFGMNFMKNFLEA